MISVAQYHKLMKKKHYENEKVGESVGYAGVDRGTAGRYLCGEASPLELRPEGA